VDTGADGWDVSGCGLGGNDCRLRGDNCGLVGLLGDNGWLGGLLGSNGELASHHAERVGLRKQGGLREGVDGRLKYC
jgi:hypothetical protein